MVESGAALTAPGRVAERRIATILFADLVGFTPLAEQLDPEEVRDILSGYFDECRAVIQDYGGVVEKFIGDAVMAVWGVPTSHGDDAERAVRAGLELADTIPGYGQRVGAPGLQLRVGIASGEVAATLGAVGQGMVSGDAVNTASRVQARATPGEVWVDDQTVSLTSASIMYADQGEFTLKGKSSPTRLHRAEAILASVGGAQRPDHLSVPLSGYRRELSQVKEMYNSAVEAGQGRLLLMAGDPGVGKTRLGRELENYLDGLTQAVKWYWGQCLSYGDGIVYSALMHAVRSRTDALETDDDATIRARIAQSLEEFSLDPTERAWIVPRVGTLLGLTTDPFAREDLFAAWLRWFEILASADTPVVWVIDDAQNADDALLDFVEHLVRSASFPIFVLMMCRPELLDRRPRLGSGRRTSFLHLEGLPRPAMEELVDHLVPNLSDQQRSTLVDQADGIPLYAIETVRAMMDRGIVVQDESGGRAIASPDGAGQLDSTPASLQVLVSSRLDLLPVADRALLQDAAVLGQSFSREDLQFLSGLPDDDLDAALDRLTHRDLLGTINDRFSPYAGNHTFVQSVVRQVAYDSLARRDRIDRHVRIANSLMDQEVTGDRAGIVAQHLADAIALASEHDPLRTALADQLQSWLERAGDRAAAIGAATEALRHFEHALEHTTDPDAFDRLSLKAARAADVSGSVYRAIAHASAVSERDIQKSAEVVDLLSAYYRVVGREEDAAKLLDRFPTPASLDGINPSTASRICRTHATTSFGLQEFMMGLEWAETGLAFALDSGDPEDLCMSYRAFEFFFIHRNQPLLTEMPLDQEIRIAREHHLHKILASSLSNRSSLMMTRDIPRALADATEALRIARQTGFLDWNYILDLNLANAQYFAGEWDGCLETAANRSLPEDDEPARPYFDVEVAASLVLEARGLPVAVPPVWRYGEERYTYVDYDRVWPTCCTANAAWFDGDTAAAMASAQRAIDIVNRAAGFQDDFGIIWSIMVDRAIRCRDFASARRWIALVESARPSRIEAVLRGLLPWLRGTLHLADPDATVPPERIEGDLRAAIAAFDACGVVPQRALAAANLGRLLTRQGRHDEARGPLNEAICTMTRLGAARWLDEIREFAPDLIDEWSGTEGSPA